MNTRSIRHLFALLIFAFCLCAHAVSVPTLRGPVNDYANVLSAPAADDLDKLLRDFQTSASAQVVLLTVPSLEGETIEQYGIAVGDAWKIGQTGKDDGVILLLALAEREVRIEVGRGLEGTLTDLKCGRIIRNEMGPLLKEDNFDDGLTSGVVAILGTISGDYIVPEIDYGPPTLFDNLFLFIMGLCCAGFVGAFWYRGGAITGAGCFLMAAFTLFSATMAGVLAPFMLVGGWYGGWYAGKLARFIAIAVWRARVESTGFGGGSGGGGGYSGGGGSFGGGGSSGRF